MDDGWAFCLKQPNLRAFLQVLHSVLRWEKDSPLWLTYSCSRLLVGTTHIWQHSHDTLLRLPCAILLQKDPARNGHFSSGSQI